MRNRPFLLLTLSVTLMFFGFYASSALGMYLNIYYIFGGVEKDASTYVGLSGTLWKVSVAGRAPGLSCSSAGGSTSGTPLSSR